MHRQTLHVLGRLLLLASIALAAQQVARAEHLPEGTREAGTAINYYPLGGWYVPPTGETMDTPEPVLIRSKADWDAFFQKYPGDQYAEIPAADEILDFRRSMVVAIFESSFCGSAGNQITSTVERGNQLRVNMRTSPSAGLGQPPQMHTCAAVISGISIRFLLVPQSTRRLVVTWNGGQ
ncbi:hypothetical protein AAFF27_12740 [Xylophilus sp. GW821-FHT01B05]